jgi:hypothetical protein
LPLILTADYRLGCLILGWPPQGISLPGEIGPGALLGEVGRLLWPMAVGSVPLAAAAWAVIYVLAVRAVVAGRGAAAPSSGRAAVRSTIMASEAGDALLRRPCGPAATLAARMTARGRLRWHCGATVGQALAVVTRL